MENKIDRRVRKTKQQLKSALSKLMIEKGVKDITVKELSEKADINRGTFYLHYKDVFDMLEQIENEMLNEFTELMNHHTPKELNGKPLPLLEDIFSFLADNADLCKVLLGKNGDMAFVNKLKKVIKDKCMNDWYQIFNTQKVDIKDDIFEYFYTFILSGFIGIFENWLSNSMKGSPKYMAKMAEEFIMTGIEVLK